MTLLYGTGNPAKLNAMRKKLAPIGIELIGLKDMPTPPPSVHESGSSPLENARIKALAYFKHYGVPVFSCDSGLYFDGLPDDIQPGVNVRRVGGRSLTDEEMTEYYSSLAAKYGRLTARYKNAVCFVAAEGHVAESMDERLWGDPFYIVDKPHKKRVEGFPLDRISVEIKSGLYYYDLPLKAEDNPISRRSAFADFFEEALNNFREVLT